MAKRILVVLGLMVCIVGPAFAIPDFRLSAGTGLFFDGTGLGGIEASNSSFDHPVEIKWINTAFSGFIFFDATFAELSLGFSRGDSQIQIYRTGGDLSDEYFDKSLTNLNISLLGKYPFWITPRFSIFPLLGIDYLLALSMEDKGGSHKNDENLTNSQGGPLLAGDFNSLSLKLGMGLDYLFTERIFLRFNALGGLRLANKFERDWVDVLNKDSRTSANTTPGIVLTVKLAVGFRF